MCSSGRGLRCFSQFQHYKSRRSRQFRSSRQRYIPEYASWRILCADLLQWSKTAEHILERESYSPAWHELVYARQQQRPAAELRRRDRGLRYSHNMRELDFKAEMHDKPGDPLVEDGVVVRRGISYC